MTRTIGTRSITLIELAGERDWWQVRVIGERSFDVRGKREAEAVYRRECRRLEAKAAGSREGGWIMSEQDDERWITERDNEPGASFRTAMRAAIARGYERGKAEREYEGQLLAIARQQRDDAKADRDRLAKRLESAERTIYDGPDADRLAALEQRVGAFVDLVIAVYDPGMPDEEYISRLAALRSPVAHLPPEVARLQCVVGVLTNERDAARRERDEALSIARRLVDGSGETLEGIIRDARALVAGQPVAESKPSNALEAVLRGRLDARDAEIERLQERCRDAAHVLVDAVGSATPANIEELAQRAATEIETLRAKLAGAERRHREDMDRLHKAQAQRDALRAHAEKLDGLCERAAASLVVYGAGLVGEPAAGLVHEINHRGEVPR